MPQLLIAYLQSEKESIALPQRSMQMVMKSLATRQGYENSLNASHIAIDLALREAAFIILGVDVILLSKQQVPNPYESLGHFLPYISLSFLHFL